MAERFTRKRLLLWSLALVALALLLAILVGSPYRLRALLRAPTTTTTLAQPLLLRPCLPAWDGHTDADYGSLLDDTHRLDGAGVLLVNIAANGWQYHPYWITAYGMMALQAWCQFRDVAGLEVAQTQAEWLAANLSPSGAAWVWRYDFPYAGYDAGWYSAFANGWAIAFLTQMHAVTGDERYHEAAAKALTIYDTAANAGGCRYVMADGSVWFEEYAALTDQEPSHVLNGHIAAVFALAYYADHEGDAHADALADEGTAAVKAHMLDFDALDHTLYQLHPLISVPTSLYPHAIHVRGLYWMYARTGDEAFKDVADRWSTYHG